jgi:hypothetical protein
MAYLLWLMAPVCLLMRRGLNVDVTRTHRMHRQLPLVAAELFVLAENLLSELAMLTPADMHEQAAVQM